MIIFNKLADGATSALAQPMDFAEGFPVALLSIIFRASGITAVAISVAVLCSTLANAAPFTIRQDDIIDGFLNLSSSYSGPGGGVGVNFFSSLDVRGSVIDGGFDAFDRMGLLSNLGSLTAVRNTETLTSQNTYRWLDTITNPTNNTVTQSIYWWGNLGSDGQQTMQGITDFSAVNVDDWSSDPYIAFVWGNNTFARNNMTFGFYGGPPGSGRETGVDWVWVQTDLTLQPGESTSLLYYTFLARDLDDRSGDVQLALDTAANLVANPFLDGLTDSQIAGIDNFFATQDVPNPATFALLSIGLAALGWRRRKQQ